MSRRKDTRGISRVAVQVRLTDLEHERYHRLADFRQQSLSELIRGILDAEWRRALEEGMPAPRKLL